MIREAIFPYLDAYSSSHQHRSLESKMSNNFIIPPVDSNIVPTFLAISVNDNLADDSDSSTSSSLTSFSLGDAKKVTAIRSRIPLAISDWAKRASLDIPAH